MRKFMLVGLVLALAIPTTMYGWLAWGLRQEGIRSSTYGAFGVAADRAIQIDRLGAIVPRNLPRKDEPSPIPKEIVEDPDRLDCNAKIQTRPFDPSREDYTRVLIKVGPPLVVYIVYSGRPPDFTPFLSGHDREFYYSAGLVKGEKRHDPQVRRWMDYSTEYRAAIERRDFSWESFVCPTFTFTIIREK
ncbi:MAG: hypothetical protein ACKVPY_17650 [Paracoccaceae bacterium]